MKFLKLRSAEDEDFAGEVCFDVLNIPLEQKPDSDEFCGIYFEGRGREINCIEDFAVVHSFKVFSKYNYPIFIFSPNSENLLNNEEKYKNCNIRHVKIPECNSHEAYSEFMIREIWNYLPLKYEDLLFFHPDGFLIKKGWDDFLLKKNWVYCGSPWLHTPAIEYLDKNGNWRDFLGPVRLGNGGFSYRKASFCRAATYYYGDFILREKFAPNNKKPPEDLFYSVIANNLTINVPTVEEANQFCCDPLTPEKYKSGNYFGFHYFSNK
jgi:hypothetical protein